MSCDSLLASTSPNEMEMVFKLLQEGFGLVSRQAVLMQQKMSLGVEVEIQLAKVVIVLCYCGFKKLNLPLLDTKTEIMFASMFHFVCDDADGLSLDGALDGFLTKASVLTFSTSSIESSSPLSSSRSPHFSPFRITPRVHFQEVFTLACSSNGVREVLKQCQDLKTYNSQKEEINELLEENRALTAQGLSEKISLKDEEIQNLRNECETAGRELTLVKEQNIEMSKMMTSNCKELVETVRKLQQELHSSSSDEQDKMAALSTEVASLKEQLSENEVQKQQELLALKEKLTSVQNRLTEAKQSELQHQETLKEKTLELEKNMRKLQAEMCEKDTQISALKAQMKEKQRRSERLELKVKNQDASILALKNVAQRFEQQSKELMEKLEITFKQLQHYSDKHRKAQEMNRSLEKSLQASRREVCDLQTAQRQARVFFESQLTEQRNRIDNEDSIHRNHMRAPETAHDLGTDCVELHTSMNAHACDDGVENRDDRGAGDWKRIAELQSRNQACLPHMKSSYPLESGPTTALPALTLTDEDLRMGDPRETIRRAALHLQDSQMDGHTPQPRNHTAARMIDLNTPQPQQRQSVMFMISNTPKMHKGGSLLQRGLKRRHDACKSPTVFSRAFQPAVRAGNSRSPQVCSR